jgi:ABC-type transport system involved in Fe-S cluster assembly fused permease/ATPase subunit
MPALALLSYRYRVRVRQGARAQRAHEGEIASLAGEALSAMAVVKASGSERFEGERVHVRSAARMRIGMEVSRLQARFDGLIGVVTAVATALVIGFGVVRIAHGSLSPGDLVVFAMYVRRLNSPLRSIAREATKVSRTMARADRIAEVLAVDEVVDDPPGGYAGPPATGALALDRVSFRYARERPVLEEVSLRVRPRSCVALVGPSGAGKSTIGALVVRLFDPAAGRVLIDGRDARECSLAWLRAQTGVVLQDTVLFTGDRSRRTSPTAPTPTAPGSSPRRAPVAADGFIRSLPEGYDTRLGPQGVGLSGGQRQRIGLARTLVRDPRILVLDEPTTGLDAESEAAVITGLRALLPGRTTLVISHSLALAATADEVIMLDGGRIVAHGPPRAVLDGHARAFANVGAAPAVGEAPGRRRARADRGGSMSGVVGVGIVGAGAIFEQHALALSALAGRARLLAVCDVDDATLRAAAGAHGVAFVCRDSTALLDRPDVDLVAVCTPPAFHEEAVVGALRTGKHVVCEKPLAPTLAAADRIIAVAREHPGRLSVVHQFRYLPAVRRTLWVRDAGELGSLLFGRFHRFARFRRPGRAARAPWWGSWDVAGGAP